jgi:hypothetical protein
MYVIVKKYAHYNRALGKYIKSKKHYIEEMKKGGFVDSETGNRIAEEARARNRKQYKLSAKALSLIREAKQVADKKGNLGIATNHKLIDGLKDQGMRFEYDWLPKHYRDVKVDGGYDAL